MKADASVRLKFASKKRLETIFKALEPETKKATTMRSEADLKKEGSFLVLKINAKDTVALRAALNAYLRWINSAVEVLEVIEA
jgi:tRNA threonylcarbamoyladenosine modification (KEOPS) complex  Pcc1 subunit